MAMCTHEIKCYTPGRMTSDYTDSIAKLACKKCQSMKSSTSKYASMWHFQLHEEGVKWGANEYFRSKLFNMIAVGSVQKWSHINQSIRED